MSADKIAILTRNKDESSNSLAKGSARGADRLRELEQLLKTAAEVQAQAEAELNKSEAFQSVAQQRKAAAESVRRKAEAEMARLRMELAREAERNKQHWSPGDPLPDTTRQQKSGASGDFEVSMIVGSASRGRFSDSAFQDSDLALDEGDHQPRSPSGNATTSRHTSKRSQTRPPQKSRTTRSSSRRSGWIIALIILLGIIAGATVTWAGAQNPELRTQIGSLPAQLKTILPAQLKTILPPSPSVAPAADTPASLTQQRPVAPATTHQPATQQPLRTAAASWHQAIAEQERLLRRQAENRFQQRLKTR